MAEHPETPKYPGSVKVTEDDVRAAYRFFLGREAESQVVVDRLVDASPTFEALRQKFIGSPEFRNKANLPVQGPQKSLTWPAMPIDTDVSPEMLERMLRHIETNWKMLGETEPHWSVLTSDRFKADKIDENLNDFYGSGNSSVALFTAAASRCHVSLLPGGTCFELGCGVGRVTLALSEAFSWVIASDISLSHLQLARDAAARKGADNIEFVHLQTVGAISDIASFDYFFSVIVLQHNPPPVIKSLLGAILRKMNSGGLAYFQVPTYRLGYSFGAGKYLSGISSNGKMEVHVLPQSDVFEIIRDTGCEVLEVREDGWAGSPMFISNSFLVRKAE